MNTRVNYLYRDGGNYKTPQHIIVKGEITENQKDEIIESLNDGLYFIPQQIGLPEERFGKINDLDHSWFELEYCDFELTDKKASSLEGGPITVGELVDRFKSVTSWDHMLWINSLTPSQYKKVFG